MHADNRETIYSA